MGMSKRQVRLKYGFNARLVETLIREGVLRVLPESTPRRPKIDTESFGNLKEGEHYVVCRECGAYQAEISTKHLRACSDLDLHRYKEMYPEAEFRSVFSSVNKAKTEAQKKAQSRKLKERFQTREGEWTRQQISEASRRLHESGYREKAAQHLRMLNADSDRQEQARQETQARWDQGDLREIVEGWHRDNREASLASAANARRHILRKRSKLHLRFKEAMLKANITGFRTEHEVGFYSLDEGHPSLKIAVEIDGCYWHGCEECGHPGVGATRSLDRRKTAYLTNRGWQVLRFPEHEINADLHACIENLQEEIRQRGES